jgi:HD-GYP domain-containing protein (c-di-GMP phosphodiesterase class II)
LGVGFSAGIAVYPAHGDDVESLISRSGAALAVAVSAEDGALVVFEKNRVDPGPSTRVALARTRSRRATARVLAAVVDARDPATRLHSENVADLASALALMLDLPPERAHVLDLAAQMHDVGKIGVPDAVLLASGVLDAQQRERIAQHPVLGERILASARLDEILPAVRHHHERWDGTGYPDGLVGSDIPLEARILAVCESYESMATPHTYAECLSVDEAIEEIRRCSGTQFDPDIAAPFCRMISQIHGASPRDRAGRSTDEDNERPHEQRPTGAAR